MSAKKAKRIREREDAMRRDFARNGRRCGLVIAVDDGERRREKMSCVGQTTFFIFQRPRTEIAGDTSYFFSS